MGEPIVEVLTDPERQIVELMAQVWDLFLELPIQHPMHQTEMAMAIHLVQRIVLVRPVERALGLTQECHDQLMKGQTVQ